MLPLSRRETKEILLNRPKIIKKVVYKFEFSTFLIEFDRDRVFKEFMNHDSSLANFREFLIGNYSEVPNKSVTFFILFWDFFPPTWPY